jgi:hypothetical protein
MHELDTFIIPFSGCSELAIIEQRGRPRFHRRWYRDRIHQGSSRIEMIRLLNYEKEVSVLPLIQK